jgi:hypothetical protein
LLGTAQSIGEFLDLLRHKVLLVRSAVKDLQRAISPLRYRHDFYERLDDALGLLLDLLVDAEQKLDQRLTAESLTLLLRRLL